MDARKRKVSTTTSVVSFPDHHGATKDEGLKRRRVVSTGEEQTDESVTKDSTNPATTHDASFAVVLPSVFAKRGANCFVPMIALDDLPSETTIAGLHAQYTMDEVEQLNGQIVFTPKSAIELKLETSQPSFKTEHDYANGNGHQVPSSKSINERLHAVFSDRVTPAISSRRGVPTAASTTTQRYNPTTPGVLGQKVYCTHWMRTGECDFTQQGCMFLHCMPDLDTLEKLGFRAYPRWFREMPRHFQEMNSKEFSPDGLNPQRVQMREMQQMNQMQQMQQAQPMPPPPPPPSESENIYGTGRKGSSSWRQSSASNFPQFQTFSASAKPFSPSEPVPLYNGQEQSTKQHPQDFQRGRLPVANSTHSLMSREGSRDSTSEKLRGHSSVVPSIAGSEKSARASLPKKPSSGYKGPSHEAVTARARMEKDKTIRKPKETIVKPKSVHRDVHMNDDFIPLYVEEGEVMER